MTRADIIAFVEARTATAGVLVVDDQEAFRTTAAALVAETPGLHVCRVVATVAEARRALGPGEPPDAAPIDVVLLDVRMPGEDPLALAADLRESCPDIYVVLVSAYGLLDIPPALLARGVGFVAKEALTPARLLAAIGRTTEEPA